MNKDYAVPLKLQAELRDRVNKFNAEKLSNAPCKYCIDTRGKFTYLRYLYPDNTYENVARLKYNGDINNMDFAIFKYSSEKYDAKDWWIMPGSECVDGKIEGAMEAGLIAYPPAERCSEDNETFFKALVEFLAKRFR